jgi:hypothetical protein
VVGLAPRSARVPYLPAAVRRGRRHVRPAPKEDEDASTTSLADQVLIVLVCVSVPIVRAFAIDVEDCISLDRLPSVAAQRPSACPHCREPAERPGGSLGMVGHGTYTRQVRGLPGAAEIVIHVRRFRCRSCQRTTAVLPAELVPWRWYAGSAILPALVGSLLLGRSASELGARIASGTTSEGWKSLERWQRDLLARLWSWRAREVGFEASREAWDRGLRARGLERLLALVGAHAHSPRGELESAACKLTEHTAHTRTESWQLARAG